jgi:uncharacterized membrane protein (UPF0127 family)
MREALAIVLPRGRIAIRVLRAERFDERLRGLLGRECWTRRHALWISPCRLVHTFGMRQAIDMVFVDREYRILRVDPDVEPNRVRGCPRAHGVLELAAGSARRLGLDAPAAGLAWVDAPGWTGVESVSSDDARQG